MNFNFSAKGTIHMEPIQDKPPITDALDQRYKEWSEREPILRFKMEDAEGEDDIHILQELLNRFLDDELSNPLTVDGKLWKLSSQARGIYQEFRMLEPGAVGPITRKDMYKAYCESWTDNDPYMLDGKVKVYGTTLSPMGDIPFSYGQISYFGGSKDCDDLNYGSAYILGSDGKSPKKYCERNRELVDIGVLRKECLDIEEYPKVQCKTKVLQASGSWCLDTENGFYCAIYTRSAFGMFGMDNPKVVIKNWKTGKLVVCLRVDHGPRPDCGAIDVSPAAMKALGIDHDGMVTIGWCDHDAELGVY